LRADAQTIGFAAVHERVRAGQAKFLQATLEKFPRGAAGFGGGAFRLAGFGTKENVPLVFAQAQRGGCGLEVVVHARKSGAGGVFLQP
jgi:hypothetical protein